MTNDQQQRREAAREKARELAVKMGLRQTTKPGAASESLPLKSQTMDIPNLDVTSKSVEAKKPAFDGIAAIKHYSVVAASVIARWAVGLFKPSVIYVGDDGSTHPIGPAHPLTRLMNDTYSNNFCMGLYGAIVDLKCKQETAIHVCRNILGSPVELRPLLSHALATVRNQDGKIAHYDYQVRSLPAPAVRIPVNEVVRVVDDLPRASTYTKDGDSSEDVRRRVFAAYRVPLFMDSSTTYSDLHTIAEEEPISLDRFANEVALPPLTLIGKALTEQVASYWSPNIRIGWERLKAKQ